MSVAQMRRDAPGDPLLTAVESRRFLLIHIGKMMHTHPGAWVTPGPVCTSLYLQLLITRHTVPLGLLPEKREV